MKKIFNLLSATVLLCASSYANAVVPAWDSNKVYVSGDEAFAEQQVFKARYWTQGNDPVTAGQWGAWAYLRDCAQDCGATDGDGSGGDGGSGDSSRPQPIDGGGYSMTKASLDATESALTDSDLFVQVKSSIKTRDNAIVEAVTANNASNPDNVKRVEGIFSQAQWDETFPMRHNAYSYQKLLQSIAKFSGFCATYQDGRDSDAICRKSLATMFAHFTQETGGHDANAPIEQWRQALVYVREAGCSETSAGCSYNAECTPSMWQGQTWPCGKNAQGQFVKYFGRGAKQLSYNYNYGPFSQAMYGDVSVLLNDPEKVADTWLNLASAVFFYVYPVSPKPSMLHVVDGTWQPNAYDESIGIAPGFGATTNVINGGIECGLGYEKPQSVNRIDYYRNHAAALNVPIDNDEELGCKDQKRFDTQGAGALNIYWDQDWAYYSDMPEGKSFACKLVGYQTAFSALATGDYQRCIINYFDVVVID